MDSFLKDNQAFFVFLTVLLVVAAIIVICVVLAFTCKIVKNLLVNRFKIIDMNEKTSLDSTPLYTIIISNNSMNAVSIASIGFEHAGDYFNYRKECELQLDNTNAGLVILPRGSAKLRLTKEQLENSVFKTCKTKHFGKLRAYLIGLGGESYSCRAKIIGKKMAESYKEYYAIHEPEVVAKFVVACEYKLSINARLSIFEKIKYYFWNKRTSDTIKTRLAKNYKKEVEKDDINVSVEVVTAPLNEQAEATREKNTRTYEVAPEIEPAKPRKKQSLLLDDDKKADSTKKEETADTDIVDEKLEGKTENIDENK